jgi:hypothetical protein
MTTMTYPQQVKSFLWSDISEMALCPGQFAKNPDVDFSRNRKLGFEDLLRFLISMQSGTTGYELLKYFNHDLDVISNSAFYQQRQKLILWVFQYLLFRFNSHFPAEKYKGKYDLVACDGSEFNIARNPNDPDTFFPSNGKSNRGFNLLHTISLYDILSKRYLDLIIQPSHKKNEFQALCDLVDRYSYEGIPIFLGDRGFSSYHFYAHAIKNNRFFLVRAKDINTKRILKSETLPEHIDIVIDLILSRSQSKKKMKQPELAERYRHISTNVRFDYIERGSSDEYPLSLRVVRGEICDGIYENIITNLPANEFSSDEILELYHMRWNIETSFRDLKHTIGAANFHSKKPEYIEQEIWARLILFNFCTVITTHVVIRQKNTKHVYQVNFAMAMKICHDFIRLRNDKPPPDVEGLIGSYTLPIRPKRTYARQHRFQVPASFCYRFA